MFKTISCVFILNLEVEVFEFPVGKTLLESLPKSLPNHKVGENSKSKMADSLSNECFSISASLSVFICHT